MIPGKFKYVTRPVPSGSSYMGQAVFGDLIRTDEVVADLAAETGVPATDVASVVRSLGTYIIRSVMSSHRIEPLFGSIGYFGSAGGSNATQDFAPTFDNLKVSLNLQLGKEGEQEARRDFSAECKGHRDFTTPDIISVTNMHNNTRGSYTPGKSIQVRLADGRISVDMNDPYQGVFFQSANGQTVRASDYAYVRGAIIACTVPASLTGSLIISVSGVINGAVRSGSWNFPLSYSAAARRAPAATESAAPTGNGNGHSTIGNGNGNGNGNGTHAPRAARPVTLATPAGSRSRSRSAKAKPAAAPTPKPVS